MSLAVECPHCRGENSVPESSIGQYVLCDRCHCRFYVPVPPLEGAAPVISAARTSRTQPRNLDEHQTGGRVMMRQEALLASLVEELAALRRLFTFAAALIVALLTAVVLLLALR